VLSTAAQPQPHHAPHMFHVPGQSHRARTSLEVMSRGYHKDLRGFTSASFGTIRNTSLLVICSFYYHMLFTITPYMFMFCLYVNTPVCCMYFASLNINLATYFSLNSLSSFLSFFLVWFRTLLLRLDLWNLRHPARERRNLQVEANASHNFGPDISIQTPSLTTCQLATLATSADDHGSSQSRDKMLPSHLMLTNRCCHHDHLASHSSTVAFASCCGHPICTHSYDPCNSYLIILLGILGIHDMFNLI